VFDVRSLAAVVRDSYAIERSTFGLAAALSLLALLLTACGIYAVVSLLAVARTPEIGLRRALGAGSTRILTTVLGEPFGCAIAGMGVGLAIAAAITQTIRSAITGLPPLDVGTVSIVAAAIALVVVVACVVPAARVLRVDPVVALRNE
jgi:ABC-type antimicrobial peptide transport system permease subunit